MNVSAVIVTRGNVPDGIDEIVGSLPRTWERVLWNNGTRRCVVWSVQPASEIRTQKAADLAVAGRYAALEYASHDLVYVQDDDCVVGELPKLLEVYESVGGPTTLVANMPAEHRPFYPDSALVGFGAIFHRALAVGVFRRWWASPEANQIDRPTFDRTCDVILSTLAPNRVLVTLPKRNLEYATDDDRMYRQNAHVGERARTLELARAVRDR